MTEQEIEKIIDTVGAASRSHHRTAVVQDVARSTRRWGRRVDTLRSTLPPLLIALALVFPAQRVTAARLPEPAMKVSHNADRWASVSLIENSLSCIS